MALFCENMKRYIEGTPLYNRLDLKREYLNRIFKSRFHDLKVNGNKHFNIVFFDLGKTLLYFHGDSQDVFEKGKQKLYKTLKRKLPRLAETKFLTEFDHSIQEYYLERDEGCVEYTTYKILVRCLESHGYSQVSPKLLHKALEGMYSYSKDFGTRQKTQFPL